MNKLFKISAIGVVLAVLVGCSSDVITLNNMTSKQFKDILDRKMEYAYFEGQKDCIEGNIKIEWTFDGKWEWKGTPWDGDHKPKWNPNDPPPQAIITVRR